MGFPQKMQERGIIESSENQWEMLQIPLWIVSHFLHE